MLEGESKEGAHRDVTALPPYTVGPCVLGALRLVPHHGTQGSGKSSKVVLLKEGGGGGLETDKGKLETLFQGALEAGRRQKAQSSCAPPL